VLGDGAAQGLVAADIAALVARAVAGGRLDAVGIDIPIGLPDAGRRRADVLARTEVGARRSSVFLTPVRPALLAADHASAVAVNRELAGEGVSIQAFALRAKLLQVDAWAAGSGLRVVEVHPEVSFARMAGAPLATRKSTWAGALHRRELLHAEGVALDDLGAAGAAAGVDDVLDAAAAAWSARRFARGEAVPLPDPPEVFSDGWPAAIWV
jgi:predicted RNase H-like nuclease